MLMDIWFIQSSDEYILNTTFTKQFPGATDQMVLYDKPSGPSGYDFSQQPGLVECVHCMGCVCALLLERVN